MLEKKKSGLLIVISSPSGAGKSTIAKKLVTTVSNIKLSVSLTTREPRLGETQGKDYKFVNLDFFKKKIKQSAFLEYAKVFNNFYGTLNSEILKKLKKGNNILLDIDWQGARQIRKKLPNDTLSIFILPPSLKELEKRLKKRKHTKDFVKNRMSKAKKEIMHWKEYDYVVVNDNLEKCIEKIKTILEINFCRPNRYLGLNF